MTDIVKSLKSGLQVFEEGVKTFVNGNVGALSIPESMIQQACWIKYTNFNIITDATQQITLKNIPK
jgi:hypothetical protein